MSFTPAKLAQLPGDGLKAIYGAHNGTVMYWAHHEKLCLIDGQIAFMGGLDLCYGRWDTNQHAIADAHPGNIDRIVFPGQDFNNARMLGKINCLSPRISCGVNRQYLLRPKVGCFWCALQLCGYIIAKLLEHIPVSSWRRHCCDHISVLV